MPFKKGDPRPENAGRKKGSQNKLTTDMKQFYFDILNHTKMKGLEGAVEVFSKSDRNKIIFYQGGFKMLPSNMDVEHSGELELAVFKMPRPEKRVKKETNES